MPDEQTVIGPHLLGRKYVPDDRDWDSTKLHAFMEPSPALVDKLKAAGNRTGFDFWAWLVSVLQWIVQHFHPQPPAPPAPGPGPGPNPPPDPPPAPGGDAPAWADQVVLDQGNYGTCVGNGWAGWGDAAPIEDTYNETDARAIYYDATVFDGSPDNPDAPGGGQQGSTVRSGAKAMQKRNRLVAYAFASTLADVTEWLNNHGPVVFGTDWTNDMFNPDANGFIVPTGGVAGGHCYLCLDHDPTDDSFLFRNSWGAGWGLNGNFKMKAADVQTLLNQQGEACLAAELP